MRKEESFWGIIAIIVVLYNLFMLPQISFYLGAQLMDFEDIYLPLLYHLAPTLLYILSSSILLIFLIKALVAIPEERLSIALSFLMFLTLLLIAFIIRAIAISLTFLERSERTIFLGLVLVPIASSSAILRSLIVIALYFLLRYSRLMAGYGEFIGFPKLLIYLIILCYIILISLPYNWWFLLPPEGAINIQIFSILIYFAISYSLLIMSIVFLALRRAREANIVLRKRFSVLITSLMIFTIVFITEALFIFSWIIPLIGSIIGIFSIVLMLLVFVNPSWFERRIIRGGAI